MYQRRRRRHLPSYYGLLCIFCPILLRFLLRPALLSRHGKCLCFSPRMHSHLAQGPFERLEHPLAVGCRHRVELNLLTLKRLRLSGVEMSTKAVTKVLVLTRNWVVYSLDTKWKLQSAFMKFLTRSHLFASGSMQNYENNFCWFLSWKFGYLSWKFEVVFPYALIYSLLPKVKRFLNKNKWNKIIV